YLAVDRNNVKWVTTSNYAFSYDDVTWKYASDLPGPMKGYRQTSIDSQGNLWLDVYRYAGGEWKRGLFWEAAHPVETDRSGQIWASSWNYGVIVYRIGDSAPEGIGEANGLPSPRVSAIMMDTSGDIWICTDRGIARIIPAEPSSAGSEARPHTLALHGNHPNPFNPSTTISFTLPRPAKTSLIVYDITGRKVRELVSGSMTAGEHTAVWDGRDERGKVVSSGVYVAHLRAGTAAASRKMLIIK
ncbi:MAG: FlgD immunoglobulin-like domain containing protein, partial [Candidatus Latescibacterota bacterium]